MADLDAIAIGQSEVEHDQVVVGVGELLPGPGDGGDMVDGVTFLGQTAPKHGAERSIVLDQ